MSRLLLYVCRMHIAGRDEEINEQRIGIEVFRRKPSFDSGADSIVRSHATRLRQRLDVYFKTEGKAEPFRIDIPRGGYIPRFYREELQPAPPAEEVSSDQLPSSPVQAPTPLETEAPTRRFEQQNSFLRPLLIGVAVVLVAIAGLYVSRLLPGTNQAPRQTEVERRFWGGLFGNGKRTLLVTGDSGLVLYETFARKDVSLPDYVAGNYHQAPEPSAAVSPEIERDLSSRRYTSVADLNLAIRLSRLPEWSDQHAEVVFARDLRASDAVRSNLILIGSRQANPWVSLVDSSMNFVLTSDGNGRYYFLNRHPLPNEQSIYRPSQNGSVTSDSSVYALICYRAGDSDTGKALLLSGIWQSGTQAAGTMC
ncbi:hypothetical protein [Silvibacterium acidisoli]|uniref:hypothetical protein n=1 Tax=Acidobacteriaceae bacterium ZG23-2 TaxID=2883246 RepID=UPI00406C1696